MESTERQRYFIISILLVVLALAALLHQAIIGEAPLLRSILKSFEGFISLQTKPARLINDFTLSSGVGGAYLNAAIMGTLTLLIIRVNGVRLRSLCVHILGISQQFRKVLHSI
jgi:predicted RND superfamily exporter protein